LYVSVVVPPTTRVLVRDRASNENVAAEPEAGVSAVRRFAASYASVV
jgi:hypothetical protein